MASVERMHIEVVGEDKSSSRQARAYAEYRVFAALARHTRLIRRVRVVIRRDARAASYGTVICVVLVALEPSGTLRTRAQAHHVYGAINRAVDRIGGLLRREIVQRLSS